MANEAAHRLFLVPPQELCGKIIYRYLPALTNVSLNDTAQKLLRAVMQAHGQREDGEVFLAEISFSTYRTNAGTRLAAMVLDSSEDLREREVSGLNRLLEGSRIAVSAFLHETRNVCAAIGVVHRNLAQTRALSESKDFEALGSLVVALEQIAGLNLRHSVSQATETDLSVLLDELKIVVAPSLRDEDVETQWAIEPGLPMVWADRSSLMQVFLNLIANSTRALAKEGRRSLSISARSDGTLVIVEVEDNAGGVTHPEQLFHPFQAGAESTGLGLYLSRSFLRSFNGELRYRPAHHGACFIVELNVADLSE
jgi:signal transduction histidine kinase